MDNKADDKEAYDNKSPINLSAVVSSHWKLAREIIYETDMVVEGDKFQVHYKAVPM